MQMLGGILFYNLELKFAAGLNLLVVLVLV